MFSIYDAIFPYRKNKDIYTDPADPKAIDWKTSLGLIGLIPYQNGGNTVVYAGTAANFALFEDPGVPPTFDANDPVVAEGSLEAPSDTSMFYTSRYNGMGKLNSDVDKYYTGHPDYSFFTNYRMPPGPFSAQNFPGTARHSETLVVNFADGHAKSIKINGTLPGEAKGGYAAGQEAIRKCYYLPFDVNGVPGLVAEPRA